MICEYYQNIDQKVVDFIKKTEDSLTDRFLDYEKIKEYNQLKVLKAMQENELSSTDFAWTTGYGYGDVGREKLEKIYASLFQTEDALVRANITSGTHALALTLKGILRPGDHLLSITDDPYDTLCEVIGIKGKQSGNLLEYGITYSKVPLKDGLIQLDKAFLSIRPETKMILIQRSTGYSLRPALSLEQIKEAISSIKSRHPNLIIMVDNCYGEFTDYLEPSQIGADLTVGSLIKNPGGSIALSGGYIVGSEINVAKIANELTAPGLGKETGLSFGTTRTNLQGLFLSPLITIEAIKAADLFGQAFRSLGYQTYPDITDKRSDIIQSIVLGDKEMVKSFCRYIQSSSAVDSHVTPWPWPMPGYEDEIIMASGSFIDGSSIEMSADGPLREPYAVYYQGAVNYYQGKFALLKIINEFYREGKIDL